MSAPAIPAEPVGQAPAIVAPQVTEHTREDKLYNAISKLTAPIVARVTAAPETQTSAPVTSTPTQAIQAVTEPAPAAQPSPVLPSLEEIDFDAEESPAPAAAPVEDGKNTPEQETAAHADLVEALSSADQDKIEAAFLRTNRGKEQLGTFKTMRELRRPPEEGGIGRIPSVDEIRAGDSANLQLTAMRHEAANNPQSFIANLFSINPENGASFLGGPQQTEQIIGGIYPHLRQALNEAARNPQLANLKPVYASMLSQYALPVWNDVLESRYAYALALPHGTKEEQEYKGRRLDALQIMEQDLLGAARPLPAELLSGSQPNGPGPNSRETQALRTQLEQERQYRQNMERQQVQFAQTNVVNSAKELAMKDIGKLFSLAGVDKVHGDIVLAPHKGDVYRMVEEILPRHNPTGWQNYEIQLQQASRGQIGHDVPAATYRTLFQNALRSSPQVRERLEGLVKGAKQYSDSQHQMAAAAQQRTASTGAPAPSSVLPASQMTRQPGESNQEFLVRAMKTRAFPGSPS